MLNALFSLDLHDMFVPTHSIAEMFVRGMSDGKLMRRTYGDR